MSVINQGIETWKNLPSRGRFATIFAAVGTIGLIAAIVFYGSQEEMAVLFSDLKPENASVIVEQLKTENVPHSLSNGGTTISIPSNKISEMRLKMASSGVLSGGHVGFDLFDKTSFGATDFAQQVNFRRAVEGELARTLEGMDEVDTARVHVTPAKESVFSNKEEGAKASIMLRVKQGKQMSADRASAIVSLAASAVEGLDPSSISVLDTSGRLLTAATNGKKGVSDAGTFTDQLDSKRKFETEAAARVVTLLAPIAGDDGVRADVSADVDFSQIEKTEEKFDPQSQVVRSQKTASEKSTESATSPTNNLTGARANDPGIPAAAAQLSQKSGNDERAATTTNYEIDKIVTKTIGGVGRLNRLTVSVVVDHKKVNNNRVARTADELAQIEKLVGAAVGIDVERGDSVVVQTMAFNQPDAEGSAVAATFLAANKEIISNAIKYGVLALITGFLLLFVFRPAKKALRAAMINSEQKLLGGASSSDDRRYDDDFSDDSMALANVKQPLTVAELESKMNGQPAGNSVGLSLEGNNASRNLDAIKNVLSDGSEEESEVVVGTMRGWLRE